ncbi:MAG: hypothetical protein ABI353_16780, partial [Isosphaeraceae bacterium]
MTVPTRDVRTARRARRVAGFVMALALTANLGCGREFFRQWADQDATEAIFEKSRDPRFRLDMFTIEPPALSRFADPYDPDRPPAPPDDRAAEALSPTPQWPHFRLLTPQEGTGYLDQMEAWGRLPTETVGPTKPPPPTTTPGVRPPLLPPPVPDATPSPFREPLSPPSETNPANSGPLGEERSPIENGNDSPTLPLRANPDPGQTPLPPQTNVGHRQDPGVQLAAFQNTVTPSSTSGANPERPGNPGFEPLEVPRPDLDPGRIQEDVDLTAPAILRRPGMPLSREEDEAVEAETADFAAILTPGALSFDEALAAGLPSDSRPYVINPAQALTLALSNSRAYQYRIEQVYLNSLVVSLNRFNFMPQGFAGMSPGTPVPQLNNASFGGGAATFGGGVGGGGVGFGGGPNPPNSFFYRTNEAPGGQSSTLSLGTVAGAGKLFMLGGRLVGAFANQTVFNFVGRNPRQPTVQSFLPMSFVQPFLRGGGRAVTLESLTLAERGLVYEVRNFTRYRQQFIPYILTAAGGSPGQAPDNPGGFGGDPNIGFLQVLQQIQVVENARRNIAAFEQILKIYRELARGPASGLSQLQVDQVEQRLNQTRQQLIVSEVQYRNSIDQYKMQLGLPPDTPVILDRGVTSGFREVFNELDVWAGQSRRDPEQLQPMIASLPELNDVGIDGRSVLALVRREWAITDRDVEIQGIERAVGDLELNARALREYQAMSPELQERIGPPAAPLGSELALAARASELPALRKKQETEREALGSMLNDLLLAAERVALENRVDLMNARAILYDSWRQLTVTANSLLGVFNIGVTNQIFTPLSTSNPFAFVDQAKQFSLVLNAELPVVRIAERNAFQNARISYRRQQRVLQNAEDQVKLDVRLEIRGMLQQAQVFEIDKRNLFLNLRQKDNILRQILAPPTVSDVGGGNAANQATQTINLTNAQV